MQSAQTTPKIPSRPQTKPPGPQQMTPQHLLICKTTDEVSELCDGLFAEARLLPISQLYQGLHAMEKIACNWMLKDHPEFATVIYTKLNAYLVSNPSEMSTKLLQVARKDEFEQTCHDNLTVAMAKSLEEGESTTLLYKEKAGKLLTLDRPEYAYLIFKQLIECHCIPSDNQEAINFMQKEGGISFI